MTSFGQELSRLPENGCIFFNIMGINDGKMGIKSRLDQKVVAEWLIQTSRNKYQYDVCL